MKYRILDLVPALAALLAAPGTAATQAGTHASSSLGAAGTVV